MSNVKLSIGNRDMLEFVGQIIDVFDDFLGEKGVTVPNPERDQDEDAAILYGTDYGNLEDDIRQILENWKLEDDKERLYTAAQCLLDNGIKQDKVFHVLQAMCSILCNEKIEEDVSEESLEDYFSKETD